MASQMANILNTYRQTMPSGGLERGTQNYFAQKEAGEVSELRGMKKEALQGEIDANKRKAQLNKIMPGIFANDTEEKWISAQKNGFLDKGLSFKDRDAIIAGYMMEEQPDLVEVQREGGGTEFVPKPMAYGRQPKQTGTKYSQGTGKMSGYVFDQQTGEFSIDPKIEKQLMVDAQKKATDEKILTPKEIAGINDKVTGLTKDVVDIEAAAKSLKGLQGTSSPAAQLAAVFKFMKALDPTSTVRESEQGMVYSAEGLAKGLSNKLNQMLGEGGLSPEGFADLVNTSSVMANSAIDSAQRSVGGYLDVLSDKIPEQDLNKLRARVPQKINIGGEDNAPDQAATPPPTNAQGWQLMQDAQGNMAYVGPNGQIEAIQ